MEKLIPRVKALGYINRWYGHTKRPFSVLEHTVIGAEVLTEMMNDSRDAVRYFLLHDLHESVIGGDMSTPDVAKYTNDRFRDARAIVDEDFWRMTGWCEPSKFSVLAADMMDKTMAIVENETVRVIPLASIRKPDWALSGCELAREKIMRPRDRDTLVDRWVELYRMVS